MTDKEKLDTALRALKHIADGECKNVGQDEEYAARMYNLITAPEMEEVEVRAFQCKKCGELYPGESKGIICGASVGGVECDSRDYIILTGKDTRPKPEPKVVEFEGTLQIDKNMLYVLLENQPEINLIGKRVIVRVEE